MKHLKFLPLALTLAFVATTNTAFAQRERASRDDRREQRAQENANLTPEQRAQNFQARIQERMKSMTPEQRQQVQQRITDFQQQMTNSGIDFNDPNAIQKARDAGLFNGMGGGENNNNGRGGRGNRAERAAADAMKQMMDAAGIGNFDVQDAIVAYVAEQNKARATLFQLAQTAATALQTPAVQPINAADDGTANAADANVATTFGAYETAVKAETERQDKALKDLDAKINYSGTPRIKSFLTLVGILNNDVLAIGGPSAIFAPTQPQNGAMQMGMDGQDQDQGGRGRRNRG